MIASDSARERKRERRERDRQRQRERDRDRQAKHHARNKSSKKGDTKGRRSDRGGETIAQKVENRQGGDDRGGERIGEKGKIGRGQRWGRGVVEGKRGRNSAKVGGKGRFRAGKGVDSSLKRASTLERGRFDDRKGSILGVFWGIRTPLYPRFQKPNGVI